MLHSILVEILVLKVVLLLLDNPSHSHTFKLEEKCYQDERIKFDHVHYIDNQPVLDLIESRPNGILPSIDEEVSGSCRTATHVKRCRSHLLCFFACSLVCSLFLQLRMPKSSDKTWIDKMISALRTNANFAPDRASATCFIIKHYAGAVTYDNAGFLEKNKDQLLDDQVRCRARINTRASVMMSAGHGRAGAILLARIAAHCVLAFGVCG